MIIPPVIVMAQIVTRFSKVPLAGHLFFKTMEVIKEILKYIQKQARTQETDAKIKIQ